MHYPYCPSTPHSLSHLDILTEQKKILTTFQNYECIYAPFVNRREKEKGEYVGGNI